MIVEVETVARLCDSDGEPDGYLPVALTMRYTPTDPYACAFVFTEGAVEYVTWHFARDVLAEGMASSEPVGDMDVQCWRGVSPGLVWLRLSNRDKCALFALDRADVARFVRRSYRLVPRGEESEHMDLDFAISKLLEPKS